MPTFSALLIAENSQYHLLKKTLASIGMQKGPLFEVIIIEKSSNPIPQSIQKEYPFISRIYSALNENPFAMMNKALKLSKGSYIQFFMPGEFYNSELVYSLISNEIEGADYPDILSSGFIFRDLIDHPKVIFYKLTKEGLESTNLHMSLLPYLFKRELFQKMGHFSTSYPLQGNFDFLCRLSTHRSVQVKSIRRVITDYEIRKFSPHEALEESVERLKIIYNHYGFGKSLYWWVAQNHIQFFKWWMKSIKTAIWKRK